MGMSKSSSGSPSGVQMVPPWVPDVDAHEPPSEEAPEDQGQDEPASPTVQRPAVPVAPAGRFSATRRALGNYARSGDRDLMRRGVGRYFRTGLGGSGTAARRFGTTATTAGTLYVALGGTPAHPTEPSPLDRTLLSGRSARQIIDAVVVAVCPTDGTQDNEVSQYSINDALSELLVRHPDADLLALSEEQREFVIERFVSLDVYRRFVLDVGKHIQDHAPSATTALSRLREIRDYIRETVSASFRKLHEAGTRLNGSRIARLIQRALRDSFDVFEEYAE